MENDLHRNLISETLCVEEYSISCLLRMENVIHLLQITRLYLSHAGHLHRHSEAAWYVSYLFAMCCGLLSLQFTSAAFHPYRRSLDFLVSCLPLIEIPNNNSTNYCAFYEES